LGRRISTVISSISFLGITFVFLRPVAVGDLIYIDNPEVVMAIGIAVFGGAWLLQRPRQRGMHSLIPVQTA
jgi:hypothetical protein